MVPSVLPRLFWQHSRTCRRDDFVRACRSAPLSSRTRTTSGRRCATAHMSAVCPCAPSFALRSAPCAISDRTAAMLPWRAAIMSGVPPVSGAMSGSPRAASNFATIAALPGRGRDPERRDAQVVRGVYGRAASDQQIRRFEVVQVSSPVEGGRAVALPRIHVGASPKEGAHGRRIAVLDRLNQLNVGGGRSRGGSRSEHRDYHQQSDRTPAKPSRRDAHVRALPVRRLDVYATGNPTVGRVYHGRRVERRRRPGPRNRREGHSAGRIGVSFTDRCRRAAGRERVGRGDDRDAIDMTKRQHVLLVAGDDHVRPSGDRRAQDEVVIRVG